MTSKLFSVFSFIIVCFGSLKAQNQDNYDISYSDISKQVERTIFKKASKGIRYKDYNSAKANYTDVFKTNPEDFTANYGMAITLYANLECAKSIPYFESALKNSKDTIAEIYFLLAQSFHLVADYSSAKQNYNTYYSLLDTRSLLVPEQEKEIAKKDVQLRITMCENGERMMASDYKCPLLQDNEKIILSYIKTDSMCDNFGGVFAANDSIVYFTSKREDDGNIYCSRLQGNYWSKAESLGWPVNTNDYEAVINISSDGKRIYFYRANAYTGALYYSDYSNNHWNYPQLVLTKTERDSLFKETVVFDYAVTASKNELFIVSDKKGGMGGKDIYIARKVNDSIWNILENIGAPVNTQYDETALSISPDGDTLYFSSNGSQSIGGFDVFVTYRKNGLWSQPQNLGTPVNTPGDDLFFKYLHKGKRACYSSSAYTFSSSNHLAMYFVNVFKDVSKADTAALAKTSVNTIVYDAASGKELAKVTFDDTFFESDKSKMKQIYDSTMAKALVSVVTTATETKKADTPTTPATTVIDTTTAIRTTTAGNTTATAIATTTTTTEPTTTTVTTFTFNNVLFDFDKSTIKKSYKKELDKAVEFLKTVKPDSKIVVAGYTDSKGSKKYNLLLSRKRADAVANYLMSKKINRKRIKVIAYGESKPIVSNATIEGRALNRRTEIIIK